MYSRSDLQGPAVRRGRRDAAPGAPPGAPLRADSRTASWQSPKVYNNVLLYLIFLASRCILHAGMQGEPSVKTLRSPLSAQFSRYCLLAQCNSPSLFVFFPEFAT